MSSREDWLQAIPLAHRGLHGPGRGGENSIESFRSAAELGYGIELDVHITADGVPVISHDNEVRVNGRDVKLDETRTSDFERIGLSLPTLNEALKAVEGRVPVLIEIKPVRFVRAICEGVSAVVEKESATFAIQSFDSAIVSWFGKHRPEWLRGQLLEIPSRFSLRTLAYSIFALAQLARSTPDFIAINHESRNSRVLRIWKRVREVPIVCWTVEDVSTYEKCRTEGKNAIFEGFLPPTEAIAT